MTISYRKKAVLHCADPKRAFESVLVTVTTTMGNGSLLVAAGTEATIADAATAVGVIDDPKFDDGFYAVGDQILVPVAKRDCIFNSSVLKFSDGALTTETLTALLAAGNVLQAAETNFARLQ